MDHPQAAGKLLAERHRSQAEANSDQSLVTYAELSRSGDWTLRSALVRLAQPEPVRAAAVLELVRWCDVALDPIARHLDNHDGSIEVDAVEAEVLPVLVAVLELDQLADVLCSWADQGSANPPLERVDNVCSRVFRLLEEAAVPRETDAPSPRSRRS